MYLYETKDDADRFRLDVSCFSFRQDGRIIHRYREIFFDMVGSAELIGKGEIY